MSNYVFLVPDAGFANHSYLNHTTTADSNVFRWGASWARQLTRNPRAAGADLPVRQRTLALGQEALTHETVLHRAASAVQQAASEAGHGGVVGLLMGHGGGFPHACARSTAPEHSCPPYWTEGVRRGTGNARFSVQLAPAGHLNVTTLHLAAIRRARRAACPTNLELSTIEQMGQWFRQHGVARVDLYACNLGTGTDGRALLNALHNLWGVPLRGMRGSVALLDLEVTTTDNSGSERRTRYGLRVELDDGRMSPIYTDAIPADPYWYRSINSGDDLFFLDAPESRSCAPYR